MSKGKDSMTAKRWARIKALSPGFGAYRHISAPIHTQRRDTFGQMQPCAPFVVAGSGRTRDIGQNEAKRLRRGIRFRSADHHSHRRGSTP